MPQAAGNVGELKLDGDLTVPVIAGIRDRLLAALRDFEGVEIDCSDAGDIDVSFLQLLIAARHTARATHRSLSLLPPDNAALDAALGRAGISLAELLKQPIPPDGAQWSARP